MTDYYDYILGLIPLAMGGTATVLALLGVSLSLALPVGAFVAVPLIGHAMFVRAPVTDAAPTAEPAQSTHSRRGHSGTAD
jgi:hypothetical protein